jgi:conjugative transfer signal peptidase TraF
MTRFGYFMLAYAASLGTLVAAVVTPEPRFIWNASASVPKGLYRISATPSVRRGDLVALRPSSELSLFMAQRHYLPLGLPLLKHVVAVSGDRVCRSGARISVNGAAMGYALAHDRRGRALPAWQGCRLLSAGQIFVMNAAVGDSFDGRYFGPIDRAEVIGRASPWWVSVASSATSQPQAPAATTGPCGARS